MSKIKLGNNDGWFDIEGCSDKFYPESDNVENSTTIWRVIFKTKNGNFIT